MPDRFTIGMYCSSSAWGGLEMNALRNARWLHQRGWPHVVYAHPDYVIYKKAREFDLPVKAVASGFRYGDLINARRLAHAIRDDGVRALFFYQSPDMLLTVLAHLLSGRSFAPVYYQNMHISDKRDWFHTWEFNHLAAWVTMTGWLAERVKEMTRMRHDRLHVVEQGIELEQFRPGQISRDEARRRFDLPPDIFLTGIIGRFDPKKGQEVAIRALRKVRDAGHAVHLLLVAGVTFKDPTGYADHIRNLVAELDLEDAVFFRDYQPDPAAAYAALDTFLMASQSETYGMVTVEAMASQLPVIGTADGGTLDLIDHERTGLLVKPMDPDDLAEAMIRFYTDQQTMKKYAEVAYKEAQERFSHTLQCERLEKLLYKIVD